MCVRACADLAGDGVEDADDHADRLERHDVQLRDRVPNASQATSVLTEPSRQLPCGLYERARFSPRRRRRLRCASERASELMVGWVSTRAAAGRRQPSRRPFCRSPASRTAFALSDGDCASDGAARTQSGCNARSRVDLLTVRTQLHVACGLLRVASCWLQSARFSVPTQRTSIKRVRVFSSCNHLKALLKPQNLLRRRDVPEPQRNATQHATQRIRTQRSATLRNATQRYATLRATRRDATRNATPD